MGDPVVVIGAGIGGLSAAIRLAGSGQRVVVLEKNAAVGGKMGELRDAGFRWDTGPSVITMRHVFEDLFNSAGKSLDDYLTLRPVEPLTRYFYPDGTVLDASSDAAHMTGQIMRVAPGDAAGFASYLAYVAELHRITGPAFIYGDPPSMRSLAQFSPLDVLKIDAWRTMNGAIGRYVQSPYLRQLLGRFATYVGASPFQAPATLNVIGDVELNGGIWYPQGGIYAIARALERLAGELGVDVRTGCEVTKIEVSSNQVCGVRLSDDSIISTRAVIANVDVATVYERLLEGVSKRRVARFLNAETSCSGFIMLLGVEGEHPALAHHNIFFSTDYAREFDLIFKQGLPADEPTVYVAITSKADPHDAPAGCENWFVLVNAPPVNEKFDWNEKAVSYADVVLSKLEAMGLSGKIRSKHIFTPLDLERQTGARRGALYGTSSNSMFSAFRRPNNRSKDVHGLYFAGGTTHPGGGVPMVMLSGKVAAGMLLADLSNARLIQQ